MTACPTPLVQVASSKVPDVSNNFATSPGGVSSKRTGLIAGSRILLFAPTRVREVDPPTSDLGRSEV